MLAFAWGARHGVFVFLIRAIIDAPIPAYFFATAIGAISFISRLFTIPVWNEFLVPALFHKPISAPVISLTASHTKFA